jgi:hypothetical protein
VNRGAVFEGPPSAARPSFWENVWGLRGMEVRCLRRWEGGRRVWGRSGAVNGLARVCNYSYEMSTKTRYPNILK